MRAHLHSVHPVLMAKDVAASVRFYLTLGFATSFLDQADRPRYAGVVRDGVELHLQWADSDQWASPADRPAYRFLVSDVDALFGEFASRGAINPLASQGSPWAAPANTPWGTREFHLRDPGQNSLQFYQLL